MISNRTDAWKTHVNLLNSVIGIFVNVVKVAVEPWGDGRVDLQTTLTKLWPNPLSITGQKHEKLTLPMCGFIAQLVEHRTGIAEVTGSNPVEALIFSGFFFPIA